MFPRTLALVPVLALAACSGGLRSTTPAAVDADAPWYTAFGIPAKEALSDPGTVSAMVRALDDDRLSCKHKAEAIAHMAQYQPAALREHRTRAETRLRACGEQLFLHSDGNPSAPLDLAAALKPVDPKLLVPIALEHLFSGNIWVSPGAAVTLKALGYASPEVLAALKKVCDTALDDMRKNASCGAHGALEALAAGGYATTDAPAVAKAGAMVILAVFDVQDPNEQFPREMMDQLTEYLATKVAEGDRNLRIVPRDQLRERLQGEKAETYKQCYDQGCQIELGRAIAAQKTLASKILKVGDKCAITATLFDLKTETAERSASFKLEGCGANELMSGMDQIAGQLTGKAEAEEKR